jgi:uncharacterized spore protein YtfJ
MRINSEKAPGPNQWPGGAGGATNIHPIARIVIRKIIPRL